jgi:hypothetical protein
MKSFVLFLCMIAVVLGGSMAQTGKQSAAAVHETGASAKEGQSFVLGYGVSDTKLRTLAGRSPSIRNNSVSSWIKRICRPSPRSQSAI